MRRSSRHRERTGPARERAVWWWLWAWAAAWTGARIPGGGGSWHYFALGSRVLFGDDAGEGLHLYAAHPDLQIGPIAFLVATPLRLLGGRLLAVLVMSATGPFLLNAVWHLVPAPARRPSRLLTAGLVFLPIWAELATHAGHLDDVLALMFAVAALHAVRSGHPVATGVLLAASADAKPWAAAFVPLLLALPGRDRLRASAAWALTLAAAWAPFLLYDGRTLSAARFTIPTAMSSGLRALGFAYANTPSWDRPAQLALGCLLGTVAVLRGRWPAVLLLGTAARILLDPEVYSYYTAGILLGALTYDLVLTARRWPLLTTAGLLSLHVVRLVAHVAPISMHVLGLLRVAYVVVAVAAALVGPRLCGGRCARGPSVARIGAWINLGYLPNSPTKSPVSSPTRCPASPSECSTAAGRTTARTGFAVWRIPYRSARTRSSASPPSAS